MINQFAKRLPRVLTQKTCAYLMKKTAANQDTGEFSFAGWRRAVRPGRGDLRGGGIGDGLVEAMDRMDVMDAMDAAA